jgi:hypothetical protein
MFIFQGMEALRIWLERASLDFDYQRMRTFLVQRLQSYDKN